MHIDTSQVIIDQCAELGISLETAQAIGKESAYDNTEAVCWAIGLDPTTLQPLRPRNWILMAAENGSVRNLAKMTEEALIVISVSGEVASPLTAPVSHLLDEAPAQILVMAAEQSALLGGLSLATIWVTIFKLAKTTGGLRPGAGRLSVTAGAGRFTSHYRGIVTFTSANRVLLLHGRRCSETPPFRRGCSWRRPRRRIGAALVALARFKLVTMLDAG